MKNLLILTAFLMLLAVMGAPDLQAQKKFPRVVTDAALRDPVEFEAPAECEGTAQECTVKMLGAIH